MAVLEASMSSATREEVKKSPKNGENKTKKVLLVAQELKLARALAGNNKTTRDRALKSLKKWFENRSKTMPFTEDDFLRIWKGLFYSMWMSDKPLIQEECAENISNLCHLLPEDAALSYFKCGMIVLMNEWFGIDHHRLDKFLMFVRRLLRQILFVLSNSAWNKNSLKKFNTVLSETILKTTGKKPLDLLLHFTEIYMEEIAKVSDGNLPPQIMTHILDPIIKQLAFTNDLRILNHIKEHIFCYLLRQSDLGIEYKEKYDAWKKLGFPGTINSMKKIEEESDNDEEIDKDSDSDSNTEKVFDPRAGRVDVELPQIKFHAKAISRALAELKFDKQTNSLSRKFLSDISNYFKKFASGIYPLGVTKVKLARDNFDTSIKSAVNRLVKFDKKIMGKKNNKKNRKRKFTEEEDSEKEIELRGGKKIKSSKEFQKLIEDELKHIATDKLKRRNLDKSEILPKKRKIREQHDNSPIKGEVESIFKRNSGYWLVTLKPENAESKSDNTNSDNEWQIDDNEKSLFPKRKWESLGADSDATEEIISEMKKRSPKLSRKSLPAQINMKDSPTKRVKINTKLNQSQDVLEHQRQILSSPAIPYDASKKPAKPLLKTPVKASPINPFYKGLNSSF